MPERRRSGMPGGTEDPAGRPACLCRDRTDIARGALRLIVSHGLTVLAAVGGDMSETSRCSGEMRHQRVSSGMGGSLSNDVSTRNIYLCYIRTRRNRVDVVRYPHYTHDFGIFLSAYMGVLYRLRSVYLQCWLDSTTWLRGKSI